MTSDTVKVLSHGLMAECTQADGLKGNNMGLASSRELTGKLRRENGRKGRGSDGSRKSKDSN